VDDPIARITAADTLLLTVVPYRVSIPAELVSRFPPLVVPPVGRCIGKPPGQLRFTLSSAQDLGFPAALDFDIAFAGTALPPGMFGGPAGIRWDINQVVQSTFNLPGGLAVKVDTVTGAIPSSGVVDKPPVAGRSCSGQARTFDAEFAWLGGAHPETQLIVVVFINGQEHFLTLQIAYLWAQSGEVEARVLKPYPLMEEPLWLRRMLGTLLNPEDPYWQTAAPATRDLIVGVGLLEASRAIGNQTSRRRIQRSILESLRHGVDGFLASETET
jgi:hypothetical protein